MTETLLKSLEQNFQININSLQQLRNGQNLIKIALKLLYSDKNQFLESKLHQYDSSVNPKGQSSSPLNKSKTGNHVILINGLLKHIKNDSSLKLQNWVRELTFYNILEDEEMLCKFVKWMIDVNAKNSNQQQHRNEIEHIEQDQKQDDQINSVSSNRFRNIEIENPRFKTEQHQKQQTGFQNLYFASNLKSKLNEEKIIISPQRGEKIVRKGSFKLLKPKVSFNSQSQQFEQPKQLPQVNELKSQKHSNFNESFTKISLPQQNIYQPEQLKEISMIQASNMNQNMNFSQPQNFLHENSQNYELEEYPNNKSLTSTPIVHNTDKETQHRKTIPKNLSKPPLYRSSSIKNKENLHNGPSDKDKTVQQSLKKKNFFNFSQSEDVSTFNLDSNEPRKFSLSQKSMNNELGSNLLLNQKSQIFSKIKSLKNQQKSEIRKFIELQNSNASQEKGQFCIESTEKPNEQYFLQSSRKECSKAVGQKIQNSSSKLLRLKNHFLQKQLYCLENQINKQKTQLQNIETRHEQTLFNSNQSHKRSQSCFNDQSQMKNSFQKSSRKISIITLNQLTSTQKQLIINWLNELKFVSTNDQEQVFQLFKNGVLFVELCNHYIGRGKPLPFFNNPKKNAEIHSNYSKVFDYLKSFSNFDQPQLLCSYELFVPYPQQNPIWNLLLSMYKLFTKRCKNLNKSSSKSETNLMNSSIKSSRKKSISKNQDQSRQFVSETIVDKEIPQFEHTNTKTLKQSSSKKHSTFTKPIEFVRQVPEDMRHKDLVQNQEPESNQNEVYPKQKQVNLSIYYEGYRQKYLKKTIQHSGSKQKCQSKSKFNAFETPNKCYPKTQYHQNQQEKLIFFGAKESAQKRSIKKVSSKKTIQNNVKKLQHSSSKMLSVRKSSRQTQKQRQLPKISLNMQMKVQKLLRQFDIDKYLDSEGDQEIVKFQLLQDPIRNGTLINILYNKIYPFDMIRFVGCPRSIQHCRQNYFSFFGMIKNRYGQNGNEIAQKYGSFVEQILKGEKALFYGIGYALIGLTEKCNPNGFVRTQQNKENMGRENILSSRLESDRVNAVIENFSKNHVAWVRFMQRGNPKIAAFRIRDEDDLLESITNGLFLYSFVENNSIKPVYLNPRDLQEKQANMRKVIHFLQQNSIIFEREQIINAKLLCQSNSHQIGSLITKLITYTVKRLNPSVDELKMIFPTTREQRAQSQTLSRPDMVPLSKLMMQEEVENNRKRLETTNAFGINESCQMNSYAENEEKSSEAVLVEVPWLRKLGFTNCSLSINNGILLCRLLSKLTRTSIKFNQNIGTDSKLPKPQSLGYIRKALKLVPGVRFDQIDVYEADARKTLQILDFIKEKFRNTYELSKVLSSK